MFMHFIIVFQVNVVKWNEKNVLSIELIANENEIAPSFQHE